jgi:putative phosphoesterase
MAESKSGSVRIGVIADTHGYLDPVVGDVFAGVRLIIHAGDILDPATIETLERVAPVIAVAGNLDRDTLGTLPREAAGEVAGVRFVVGHKRKRLLKRLALGKIESVAKDGPPDLIVFGHDHVPAVEWVEGSLYLNPGTATSPHEEDEVPTVAVVEVEQAGLSVRFVPLPRSTRSLDG